MHSGLSLGYLGTAHVNSTESCRRALRTPTLHLVPSLTFVPDERREPGYLIYDLRKRFNRPYFLRVHSAARSFISKCFYNHLHIFFIPYLLIYELFLFIGKLPTVCVSRRIIMKYARALKIQVHLVYKKGTFILCSASSFRRKIKAAR